MIVWEGLIIALKTVVTTMLGLLSLVILIAAFIVPFLLIVKLSYFLYKTTKRSRVKGFGCIIGLFIVFGFIHSNICALNMTDTLPVSDVRVNHSMLLLHPDQNPTPHPRRNTTGPSGEIIYLE